MRKTPVKTSPPTPLQDGEGRKEQSARGVRRFNLNIGTLIAALILLSTTACGLLTQPTPTQTEIPIPTPTSTPQNTLTPSRTATPTARPTITPTPSNTPTITPTQTPSPSPYPVTPPQPTVISLSDNVT